ncbi:MAG: HAD-IB family phosphatase [Candidatus Bathyarchaeota archaeon]|nr:HAD-IB family phosphatase [Candidatus Bathyarchaeum sp.]
MSASPKNQKIKPLVVFDVEGIIIPKNRFLVFEMSRKTGFFSFIKIVLLGVLYESRLVSLELALKKIYQIFKGTPEKEVLELTKTIPFMPGTEKVFKKLKTEGYTTALISSGLPTKVVQELATTLQVKYAYGINVEVKDGLLTGNIENSLTKEGAKAVVLKKILETEKRTPKDCIIVADDRNNLPMFPLSTLHIGYNPDFSLTAKSDFITRGALTEILPPILGEKQSTPKNKKTQPKGPRELIHIGSFLLTFISMHFLDSFVLATLIIIVTLLYTLSEIARIRGINLPVLSFITWKAANKTELYEFATSPIFFALGIAVSLLVFPEPISYASIAVLTLGDGGAHLFGMKFGKHPLPTNKGKSIEGTIAGFVCAFLGALFFVNPLMALVAAAVGMLIEGLPNPLNDNLLLPLVSGLVLVLIM